MAQSLVSQGHISDILYTNLALSPATFKCL